MSSGQSEPVEAVIDKEQQAVIRRALEDIPDSYREPMILFYREQKSLKQVAEQLGLSHEAARTRVSRGRKLLREQVAAMVEDAIGRTGPGKAFTAGVVASIAGMAIKDSGIATAVGVGAAASATGATSIVKTLMSGTTAKIVAAATVAAVAVGTAVVYKQINRLDHRPDFSGPQNNALQEREHDKHEFHFRPGRTSPSVYLRQGRYQIRYSLRQGAYRFQPPLLEGAANVDLVKGQTTTILVTEN